jgi:hypothetical protein
MKQAIRPAHRRESMAGPPRTSHDESRTIGPTWDIDTVVHDRAGSPHDDDDNTEVWNAIALLHLKGSGSERPR